MTESVYPKRKDGKVDRRYRPTPKETKKKYSRYKNVNAPKGKHWCTEHKDYEPVEKFSKNKAKTNGLNDRCREGQREYRLRYEAQYGNPNQHSKTIRVPVKTHELFKSVCKDRGTSMQSTLKAAIVFYLQYACTYPECTNPKGAKFGRCAEHVYAVSPTADRQEAR